jgi:ribosomal protein S18 acetylase RimI-like enzyme
MDVTYRPIAAADLRATAELLTEAVDDLGRRKGSHANSTEGLDEPAGWERRRSLWEHIASTSSSAWLAERDGRMIGYARAIERDGVRELTEFFVRPAAQSAGIGRELLERTFPTDGARHRTIIATSDARALGRYLKLGLAARFPIYTFAASPAPVEVPDAPRPEPMAADQHALDELADIDRVVIGHRRDVDHVWLRSARHGWLYRRDGRAVAYAYHGPWGGPIAALDEADIPGLLAHAESEAHAAGRDTIDFEVPLLNTSAVGWLLRRGYRMDPFLAFFMSDADVGRFDRYLLTSPPLFL